MTAQPDPLVERLVTALRARGDLRICQAIVLATGAVQPYGVRDEDLVALLESYVFDSAKGSRDGLHGPAGHEVSQ